jgi:tungstate transport system substrate-binding protein
VANTNHSLTRSVALRHVLNGVLGALLAILIHSTPVRGAEPVSILVASTTSTEQSGLFAHLLPRFQAKTGVLVKVVAVGTGQALDIGRRGDADVLFVHDRPAEDQFIAQGFGVARRDVMYNDYVLVGPIRDPAGVRETVDPLEALRRIAASATPFVSRGDRSGTHATELKLWQAAGIEANHRGNYRESGSGMGPTLTIAAAVDGYTLADRGTWLSFRNRQTLEILLAGDKRLTNPYGAMLVNPQRHLHVKREAGMAFIDWLVSAAGREAIASYRIQGEQLFFPGAPNWRHGGANAGGAVFCTIPQAVLPPRSDYCLVI